jgi:transposase
MHPSRIRKRAIALYADRGLTCRATSKRLANEFGRNVTPQTVARWAREAGVNRRPGGRRFALSGADLEPLYTAGASVSQLADRFHVSRSFISERLSDVHTRIRPSGTRYTSLTKDTLRRMYWTEDMSTKEIAARVGCSQTTVHYRLRAYRIPRKQRRRSR